MADVDWPDFDVPADALVDGAAREAATPEPPPAVTLAAPQPPAVAAVTPPPAAAPGTTAVQPPPSSTGEQVPQYRLDEIAEQRNVATRRAEAAERRIAELEAANARPTAVTPPPAAAAVPPNAADLAIKARMEELYPGLANLEKIAKLAEREGDITAASEATKAYADATQRIYDNHTDTQLVTLHDLAAAHVLGEGKKAGDLAEIARQTVTTAFAQWVFGDPARSARFDKLDTKLVAEFWPIYRAAVYDPVRRSESAATLTAAQARPNLPVGGAISAPVAPAPPKPPAASEDEDAIHERTFALAQAAMAGS